jgi:transcription antitermination factor NusB
MAAPQASDPPPPAPPLKKRTRSRELALQFLYQVDLLGPEKVNDLTSFLQEQAEGGDAETTRYARLLVEGTLDATPELDAEIQLVAQNWQVDRMAVIDRNVLRMAAFEILHCDEIPPKVAINEGIELGKRFSTQNSGAFINGILDKIKNRASEAER